MADFSGLLPGILARDPRFAALAAMLDRWQGLDVDAVRTLGRIGDAGDDLLVHLADWLSLIDEAAYRQAASDEDRRALLLAAVSLHRRKGTPASVRAALDAIGFGRASEIVEGAPQKLYDGAVSADGSFDYGYPAWAEWSIVADLGDRAGIDAGTSARVRAAVEGVAPARCRLAGIWFKADMADGVDVFESTPVGGEHAAMEMLPWPSRYDGGLRYDRGILLLADGAVSADGSFFYAGWDDGGFGGFAEDDPLVIGAVADGGDYARRLPVYDGLTMADGRTDYGDAAPPCVDDVMVVTVARRLFYDGRDRYSTVLYDGAVMADGTGPYMSGMPAAGVLETYLEA